MRRFFIGKALGFLILAALVGGFFVLRVLAPSQGETPVSDEAATVRAHIDEMVGTGSVMITPREVLEDSRCPEGVQCIWAGTVKLRAQLVSGLGSAPREFELGVPVVTEVEEITLVSVEPAAQVDSEISDSDYVFNFVIKNLSIISLSS